MNVERPRPIPRHRPLKRPRPERLGFYAFREGDPAPDGSFIAKLGVSGDPDKRPRAWRSGNSRLLTKVYVRWDDYDISSRQSGSGKNRSGPNIASSGRISPALRPKYTTSSRSKRSSGQSTPQSIGSGLVSRRPVLALVFDFRVRDRSIAGAGHAGERKCLSASASAWAIRRRRTVRTQSGIGEVVQRAGQALWCRGRSSLWHGRFASCRASCRRPVSEESRMRDASSPRWSSSWRAIPSVPAKFLCLPTDKDSVRSDLMKGPVRRANSLRGPRRRRAGRPAA